MTSIQRFWNCYALVQLVLIIVVSSTESTVDGTCSLTCNNNGICSNEKCVCYQGWTGASCGMCDKRIRLTASKGYIYEAVEYYEVDAKCSWLIDSNSSKPIKLTFKYLQLECGWDHLYVFDGNSAYSPLVGSFSGNSPYLKEIILRSGYGYLYFFSDIAYKMLGFNISYEVLECLEGCSGHGTCNSLSQTCVCDQGWSGVACNISASCSSGCSSNGVCSNGTCICNSQYTGSDCSVSLRRPVWLQVKTTFNPPGRASFGAAVLDGYYYVFGGETMRNRYVINEQKTSEFFRLNIGNKSWEKLGNSWNSSERTGLSLVAYQVSKKLYAYGGRVNGLSTSDFGVYDTESSSWQTLQSGIIDVAGHTSHVIEEKVYVFFGQSSTYSYVSLVQVYDIDTNKWAILPTSGALIKGGYGHSSVYDQEGDSVYFYGGFMDSKSGSYLVNEKLFKLNLSSLSWEPLLHSHQMNFHSSALLSGMMFVFGGTSHNVTSSVSPYGCFLNQTFMYDTCCGKWYEMAVSSDANLMINRHSHHMYAYNNTLYVYGGFDGIPLDDTVSLHFPSCNELTEMTCGASTRFFNIHRQNDMLSMCSWNSLQGRCQSNWNRTCVENECDFSSIERGKLCFPNLTCTSCLSIKGCSYDNFYNRCVYSESANLRFTTKNIESCPEMSCSGYNCRQCSVVSHCEMIVKECKVKPPTSSPIRIISNAKCDAPCSSYRSCANCSSTSRCMWCESSSSCVDTQSFLTSFPYGQCLDWTTNISRCPDVSCSSIQECSKCQSLPQCGWCNDPSNTGKGQCKKGTSDSDLDKICPADDWFFSECPACQCNGHSICNSDNECVSCADNTTGLNCESCLPGSYGTPENGGLCKSCACDGVGDSCHPRTGACNCMVQGTAGAKCDRCDQERQFYNDSLHTNQCYYRIQVDFKYTFNYSKPEDRYVTVMNLQTTPKYQDRDVEVTIQCFSLALVNLSFYAPNFHPVESIFVARTCGDEQIIVSLDYKRYFSNIDIDNSTFFLTLYSFQTPFAFKVGFSQQTRINLFTFFFVFFGCFLTLLIIAGAVWKIRVRFITLRRQQAEQIARRNMASRPFASLLIPVECFSSVEKATNTRPLIPLVELQQPPPIGPFQRTLSRRNKLKTAVTSQQGVTAVASEFLFGQKSAVVSVLVKLPTGDEVVPGYGQCGLSIGTALISLGPNTSNHSTTKVGYKNGKVMFKTPSLFSSV